MERIKDGRRNIIIHGNTDKDDVPVTEFPEEARIGGMGEFVPANMKEPILYPGDVVVGIDNNEISFAELIYDKIDDGVLVDPLTEGTIVVKQDQLFSRRFYQADEIHVYANVVSAFADRDGVEFDVDKVERPGTNRTA